MGVTFFAKNDKDNLEDFVLRARNDNLLRNKLINSYKPFIYKTVSKSCGRFVTEGRDEEISVGLMAFNEAIDKYDPQGGTKFLTFATMVMKRRLIDFFRKQKKHSQTVSVSRIGDNDSNEVRTWDRITKSASIMAFRRDSQQRDRQGEIVELTRELNKYGITFKDLVKNAPKTSTARFEAAKVASFLCSNTNLLKYLKDRKQLPLKELTELASCSRKTIERKRKYIVALTIIKSGAYPLIEDYVNALFEGGGE